ncbi:MAG: type IV toxin-antitoxin system AbiEi family antitoxin domain-containing protein [Culicoidibacterales bacterium]
MNINKSILEFFEQNTVLTTKDIQNLGFSKMLLTYYMKENLLVKVGYGMYMLPDTIYDDMYIFMLKSKKIIFSHESAAFLNGLSDRTPFINTVTVPQNKALSKNMRDECICFYVKESVHRLGEIEKTTLFGNVVRCYDPERTICDLVKNRNRIDEETFVSIIKNYANSPQKNLYKLGKYAEILNVLPDVRKYMEVLS